MRSSKWSVMTRVRHPVSHTAAVVWAALAAISIVVMSVSVADGDVGEFERRVFDWINGWPDWLEWPLWVLQQPGASSGRDELSRAYAFSTYLRNCILL